VGQVIIVYPRETPPHIRTARASPQRHTAAGTAAPHHRRHGEHSPTARQPHSNGLCRRACAAPSLRLPLAGIRALARVDTDPRALLAAAGGAVLAFDVRKLPAESPAAKAAPGALARFEAPAGTVLHCAAALGGVIAAGDSYGNLHVWYLGV